jgi:hypothetical protein
MTTRLQCPRCHRNAFKLSSWVRNSWSCPHCGAELAYSRRQRILASLFAFLLAIFVALLLKANGAPWSRARWVAIWFIALVGTTALTDRVELAPSHGDGTS